MGAMELAMATPMLLADTTMARGQLMLRPSLMPMVSTAMALAILAIPPTAMELATLMLLADTTMARGRLRPSPSLTTMVDMATPVPTPMEYMESDTTVDTTGDNSSD